MVYFRHALGRVRASGSVTLYLDYHDDAYVIPDWFWLSRNTFIGNYEHELLSGKTHTPPFLYPF